MSGIFQRSAAEAGTDGQAFRAAYRLSRRFQNHRLAQIDLAHLVQHVRLVHDLRLTDDEDAGEDVRVLVDLYFVIVDLLPACHIQRQLADDVLHAQQVGQRVVQTGRVVEGRDAVVEQLALRLDGLHVLDVLAGDDRVVAAHVLQAGHPRCVGVERLAGPLALESGDAEERRIGLQKGDAGRRRGQQVRIAGRVEVAQHQKQVQHQNCSRSDRQDGRPADLALRLWPIANIARASSSQPPVSVASRPRCSTCRHW